MPKQKRQRRSPAEIQDILADLQESSLSRRRFATNRHIPLSTLQSWIRKHRLPMPSVRPEVIPVGTFPDPSTPIEIELPGGVIIRLGAGFHSDDLRSALVELRRC